VTSIAGSIIAKVGSAVCVGSSMFANLGMITKIVQNIRFMKINVSDELRAAFNSWSTDFFSWNIPEKLSSLSESEPLPEVFAQYEMDSRFIVNYWATLTQSLIGIVCFVGFKVLKFYLKGIMNRKGFASLMLDYLVLAASNFTIIHIYGCLDDIVFYGLIDLRFSKFTPTFSSISSVLAILLLITGALIFMLHIWILWEYKKLKRLANKEALQNFLNKFEPLQILYQDFTDTTTIRQSFFALLITRSTFSSLIMSTLSEKPLIQAILLMVLSVSALSLLILKGPYKELYSELIQYFYELIVFLVYLGVLIMAVADEMGKEAFSLRKTLGKWIVILNAVLFIGSMAFMCIEIYGKICEIYEMWLESKASKALSKVHNESVKKGTETTEAFEFSGPRERSSVYIHNDNSHLQSFAEANNHSVSLIQGRRFVCRKNQIKPSPRLLEEGEESQIKDHPQSFESEGGRKDNKLDSGFMTNKSYQENLQERNDFNHQEMEQRKRDQESQSGDKKIAEVFKKKFQQKILPENLEFTIQQNTTGQQRIHYQNE